MNRPGAVKVNGRGESVGLAGAVDYGETAKPTAEVAAASGVPGARVDVVSDHVQAIRADGVGLKLTNLGRDSLALLVQRSGLLAERGVAQQRYRRDAGQRADDYDRGSHGEDIAPPAPFDGRRSHLLVAHRLFPRSWRGWIPRNDHTQPWP